MSILVYLFGMITLFMNRKNIIFFLLSLEILMLGLVSLMMSSMMSDVFEMMIFYLVMVVCEACFGLAMMVMMVNFYGKEEVNSLMMVK